MSPFAHSSGCGLLGACAGVVAAFLIGTVFCEGWSCFGLAPSVGVAGALVGLVLGLIFGVMTRNNDAAQATLEVALVMVGLLVAGVVAYQLLMPWLGN